MIFNPDITACVQERIDAHNQRWKQRLNIWERYVQAPWWGNGLVISPELRGRYEAFLPIQEYMASLRNVARAYLPSEEWLPYPLRQPCHASLPDLWADLPTHLAGTPLLSPQNLLPLLCAMADPPSFGTLQGRYPRQLKHLLSIASHNIRICDIACGVGLNTLEMAKALAAYSPLMTGITGEHLEVWMAQHQCLPHDSKRQKQFSPSNTHFMFGLAEDFHTSADIIVCNGLIGGRFFHTLPQFAAFLNCCKQAHAHTILAANHFHDGRRHAVYQFMNLARSMCWQLHGSWKDMVLESFDSCPVPEAQVSRN